MEVVNVTYEEFCGMESFSTALANLVTHGAMSAHLNNCREKHCRNNENGEFQIDHYCQLSQIYTMYETLP